MIDKETYRRIYSTAYQAGRRESEEGAEAAVIAARKNEYAGYRRGVEETEARLRSSILFEVARQQGAEEMRERAAQAAIEDEDGKRWSIIRAIRALPLTPEEPQA